jgi:hypothetical protein
MIFAHLSFPSIYGAMFLPNNNFLFPHGLIVIDLLPSGNNPLTNRFVIAWMSFFMTLLPTSALLQNRLIVLSSGTYFLHNALPISMSTDMSIQTTQFG